MKDEALPQVGTLEGLSRCYYGKCEREEQIRKDPEYLRFSVSKDGIAKRLARVCTTNGRRGIIPLKELMHKQKDVL